MTTKPYTSADEALRNAITLSGGATVDAFAAEIRAHLAEAGYKILPREPTDEMLAASCQAVHEAETDAYLPITAAQWRVMWTAAK